jgi:HSP20 family protein
MAQDRGTQTRDENATQTQQSGANASGAGASGANPSGSTAGGANQPNRSTGTETGRDRQRAIQTSNEPSTGSGMARRAQQTPAGYGTTGTPFSLMRRMAEDMDRLFEDFGFGLPGLLVSPKFSAGMAPRSGGAVNALQRAGWVPQIETFRRGDKLVLRADLPGMRKEDVSVEVEDGILTISGERSAEDVEDRDGFYHSERSYGQFQRSLALPEGVTGDSCEATFKDGVLEVTMPVPKQAERSARKVQIR